MKTIKKYTPFLVIALLLLLTASMAGCGQKPNEDEIRTGPPVNEDEHPDSPSDSPPETSSDTSSDTSQSPAPESHSPSPPPSSSPTPEVTLVPYDGIVEHLFFHEVIAYPELAFRGDSQQKGYDDNMVTVGEFNKMLDGIYKNGFILVDMNDVWSEYTDGNGQKKMKKNTLMLPEGKKPIILSFDDITFYKYMNGYGFMDKLIIGDDGEIWASGRDPQGNPVVTQDMTVVTLLDRFVKEHPDFSLGGVKGCIALTGYEGILGYRTQTDRNDTSAAFQSNRRQEIARVRPIIAKLKETGWYFATHSYGHISIGARSFETVKADALRWMDEVGSLVGETQIFIYPFGSRLDGDDVNKTGPAFKFYHELGFRLFASVGRESYSKIKSDISAVICDRMHADGISLRNERERYLMFYDAIEVFDSARPKEYGNKW